MLRSVGSSLRRWIPFFVVLVVPLVMSFRYIQRTFVNVEFADGLLPVPMIGRFLAGHWSFTDLFGTPFGEHLLLGYRGMELVNARLFAFDLRFDAVMFVVAFALTAAIIYAEFSKAFAGFRTALLVPQFLPLGFLCFSLVATPGGFMTTQFVWGTMLALLVAWLLQRDWDNASGARGRPIWPLVCALVLLPIYFFVFSGAYFPGLLLGLVAMYAFHCLLSHVKWRDLRTLAVLLTSLACAVGYFLVLMSLGLSTQSTDSGGIANFFSDPGNTLLSYVAGIGASVIDVHTLERFSSTVLLIVGGLMAATGVVAAWLFIRTKMYQKTYLPVYCIFYTLGIITSVRMGRGLLGDWTWVANEWYAFHMRFFAIGVAWILVYALVQAVQRIRRREARLVSWTSWPIVFVTLAALVFGAIQFGANVAQWHRGWWVQQWFEQKRLALLYPQLYDAPAEILLASPADVAAARALFQQYDLSSFSSPYSTLFSDRTGFGVLRFDGWSSDDWVGYEGRAALTAPAAANVRLTLFVPEFIPANQVVVRLDDSVVFDASVAGGTMRSFSVQVHRGLNVVRVTCQQAISPASLGVSGDIRPLGCRLTVLRLSGPPETGTGTSGPRPSSKRSSRPLASRASGPRGRM
jgi:hypothetical protein